MTAISRADAARALASKPRPIVCPVCGAAAIGRNARQRYCSWRCNRLAAVRRQHGQPEARPADSLQKRLSPAQREDARQRRAEGEPVASIAKAFGVTPRTIYRACRDER